MKPLSTFIPETTKKVEHPASVVWARILDKRFCFEVQRSSDPYKGTLVIFDGKDDFKVLHTKEVTISYGAPFGADVADANEWDDYVANWVDNVFNK